MPNEENDKVRVDPFQRELNLKVAEWRGYTLNALENLNEEVRELRSDIKDLETKFDQSSVSLEKKLDRLNGKINGLYVKVATLGGTVSVIVALLAHFLFKT